jgi:hypothetical protein
MHWIVLQEEVTFFSYPGLRRLCHHEIWPVTPLHQAFLEFLHTDGVWNGMWARCPDPAWPNVVRELETLVLIAMTDIPDFLELRRIGLDQQLQMLRMAAGFPNPPSKTAKPWFEDGWPSLAFRPFRVKVLVNGFMHRVVAKAWRKAWTARNHARGAAHEMMCRDCQACKHHSMMQLLIGAAAGGDGASGSEGDAEEDGDAEGAGGASGFEGAYNSALSYVKLRIVATPHGTSRCVLGRGN